jgi:hypothetical protein
MSRAAIGNPIDLWLNEPEFRAAVRRDPQAAVRAEGVELDPDESAALREIDWSLPDEELNSRLSKYGG